MSSPLSKIEHYLELAETAVRAAETANDLDSFRHFVDKAARQLRAARTAAAAAAPMFEDGTDRLPTLSLVA